MFIRFLLTLLLNIKPYFFQIEFSMSKLFSFQKITLSLLCVLFFSVLAFGQDGNLPSDLSNSFKKFNVIRLDNQAALQRIEAGSLLTISTAEKTFELNLMLNDLRSARYRAEDTSASGVHTLEKGETTTYRGKVAGETDSEVRLTIDDTKIEGYFESKGERFFIEPAQKYSRFAGKEDFIVYQEKDLLNPEGLTCRSDLIEKIERGREMVATHSFESPQTLSVIEVATEADFEFVVVLGGANQANSEILNILNMVEGVYERELSLTISVVYQSTWSTPDPFSGVNTEALLRSFQSYWNVNRSVTTIPRDIAHLFTAKPNALMQGTAFIGVICRNPASAYGLTGRVTFEPAKFILTAHEIGHNLGAYDADTPQNCGNTIMNFTITPATPFTFCAYSRTEITNFILLNNSCLSPQNSIKSKFDFDGDGRADISVFRPSKGVWYIANSSNNSFSSVQFGQNGDRSVAADYDGDGKTDIAVYRGGVWYRLKSMTNTFDAVYFGVSTDIPAPADFDGDDKADIAVFRPTDGTWYRLLNGNGNAYSTVKFGVNGDMPLAADYDGDGKADINVFRPSNGDWYRINSSNQQFTSVQFGQNGDKPVIGDFDGDGKIDVAVFRPSKGIWYVLNSANGTFSTTTFGQSTDIPTTADYDGDGKTDISVFRPSDGYWYRFNSSNNSFASVQFGSAGDIPVPACYIQ